MKNNKSKKGKPRKLVEIMKPLKYNEERKFCSRILCLQVNFAGDFCKITQKPDCTIVQEDNDNYEKI